MRHQATEGVIVACPDARPPAYQAVVGLARAGLLHSFLTAFYYGGDGPMRALGRRLAPDRVRALAAGAEAAARPRDPARPGAFGLELRPGAAAGGPARAASGGPAPDGAMADPAVRSPAGAVAGAASPGAALVFSDVGSEFGAARSAGGWASRRS